MMRKRATLVTDPVCCNDGTGLAAPEGRVGIEPATTCSEGRR
ncbi:MAG: hypothetical protein V3T92_01745 [Anaerolineae bacterium]